MTTTTKFIGEEEFSKPEELGIYRKFREMMREDGLAMAVDGIEMVQNGELQYVAEDVTKERFIEIGQTAVRHYTEILFGTRS